jgi:hypothetical protein
MDPLRALKAVLRSTAIGCSSRSVRQELDPVAIGADIAIANNAGLREFVVREVLHSQPHCFRGKESLYQDVRGYLATGLRAIPSGIYLVGSGSTGFSLAPRNFPARFHDGSDLDFAVVSESLFDQAWTALLDWGHPQRPTVAPQDLGWFEERRTEIFWGWLDPQYMRFKGLLRPSSLEGLRELQHNWFTTFKAIGDEFPGTELASRKSSARLYRTSDHLIRYQVEGLRRLQRRLRRESGNSHGLQEH